MSHEISGVRRGRQRPVSAGQTAEGATTLGETVEDLVDEIRAFHRVGESMWHRMGEDELLRSKEFRQGSTADAERL